MSVRQAGARRFELGLISVAVFGAFGLVHVTPGLSTVAWTGTISSPIDENRRLQPLTETASDATVATSIDVATRGQSWQGVGAALTDASVALLENNPSALASLYSPIDESGARLNLLRLPLTATDFSTEWWTWEWNAGSSEATPPAPAIAATELAAEIAWMQPRLSIMATPWTAPPEMKNSGDHEGGSLRFGQEREYGDLIAAQLRWLGARGLPITAVTVVNEPGHVADYPTMSMSDAQLVAVGTRVSDQMSGEVELWLVDHNWADRDRFLRIHDAAPDIWSGAAFHCYRGSPSQMSDMPVPVVISECTGTDDGWSRTFSWDARNLVVDPIRAGSTGLYMWNLALDRDHGPKRAGGCETCRGLLTVDTTTGALERTPEFYTLAHLSRAADPGAVRLASSSIPEVPTVAFSNADGTVGVFGHNDTDVDQIISIRIGAAEHRFEIAPGNMFTVRGPARAPTDMASEQARPTIPFGFEHRRSRQVIQARRLPRV